MKKFFINYLLLMVVVPVLIGSSMSYASNLIKLNVSVDRKVDSGTTYEKIWPQDIKSNDGAATVGPLGIIETSVGQRVNFIARFDENTYEVKVGVKLYHAANGAILAKFFHSATENGVELVNEQYDTEILIPCNQQVTEIFSDRNQSQHRSIRINMANTAQNCSIK